MNIDHNSQSQKRKRQRHEFLLSFFDTSPVYQEKVVNSWYLVKHLNGGTGLWEVNIYTKESFEKYREFVKSKV